MSASLSDRNRPLSVREREQIRNRIRENEQALNGKIIVRGNRGIGAEGYDARRMGRYQEFLRDDVHEDSSLLRSKINRDERLLASGDPKNLSNERRAEIEKQVKQDTAWVKKQMCPKKLFYTKTGHSDFQTAVEACKREHTEQYKAVANRLKENLRRIDPDGDSSLEKFRPKS